MDLLPDLCVPIHGMVWIIAFCSIILKASCVARSTVTHRAIEGGVVGRQLNIAHARLSQSATDKMICCNYNFQLIRKVQRPQERREPLSSVAAWIWNHFLPIDPSTPVQFSPHPHWLQALVHPSYQSSLELSLVHQSQLSSATRLVLSLPFAPLLLMQVRALFLRSTVNLSHIYIAQWLKLFCLVYPWCIFHRMQCPTVT